MADGPASDRDAEAAFVARLQARDETAFNELVQLYQQRVFALVFRMLGRRAEAEEITQETFVQCFRAIDRFRGDSKLSTWLFRVAVNLSKNRMKYNARRAQGQNQDLDAVADHTELGSAEGVSVGSVERPDELAQGRQLEVIVKQAIMEIDPEFRQLVILRDVEDLSYEEIAEVTGLPRGTVKSRIHRGRAQLRSKVERLMGERLGKGKKA
ncbi:MAG: sigma-70 family RNA polymerase sigma factor [Polyangiaceae bacterium]